MQRSVPLMTDETYHVFNRGAHKQDIFKTDGERERFQALLLVCNRVEPIHLANLLEKYKGPSFIRLFEDEVVEEASRLVDVHSYCLMPNHFHLVLRQRVTNGITTFMRKVGTAYSMYFNAKHDHSGTLFQGRFKSAHIDSNPYFQYIFQYIHLNPLELFESGWKERGIRDTKGAEQFLHQFRWSSHYDYTIGRRPERSILHMRDVVEGTSLTDAIEFVRGDIKDRPLY